MDTTTDKPELSDKTISSLNRFVELIEVPRFRRNIRHILFSYLMTQYEEPMPDFQWFIEDMRFFFEFLDDLEPFPTETT